MAFLTVTPEQLRSLAATCNQQADAVNSVGTTVNSNVNSVEWDSPAATQFKNEWATTHWPNLRNLMQALQSLGASATQMASQYEQADASYRGTT
jgi:WXG100 family type VII secretion target